MEKKCGRCKVVKDASMYNKNKNTASGLHSLCKACRNAENMARRTQIKAYNDAYRQANLEAMTAKSREHYAANREHYAAYRAGRRELTNELYRQRLRTDAEFRLKNTLRSAFHRMLRKNRKEEYDELLGCTLQELQDWLEYQFPEDGSITWENYGTVWQIDHVLPIAGFTLAEGTDRHICYHWTNLQPMDKDANSAKRARYVESEFLNCLDIAHRYMTETGKVHEYQRLHERVAWVRATHGLDLGNNLIVSEAIRSEAAHAR